MNVKRLLKKKLININKQILDAKKLIKDLKVKKNEIKGMLVNEKHKSRTDTLFSVESKSLVFPSKTSVSYDENLPKSQMSLYTLDEKKEESISLSQTSISLSPIKLEKPEPTEPIRHLFSFRSGSININEMFNPSSSTTASSTLKNIKTVRSAQEKIMRTSNRFKTGAKISSRNDSLDQDRDFESRGAGRNLSASPQGEFERIAARRPLPMSMNVILKGDDEVGTLTNFSDAWESKSKPTISSESNISKPRKELYRKSFSHNLPEKFEIKRQRLCI